MNKLTKSNFLTFLSCRREFWLAHHSPEVFVKEESLQYAHLREQGYKFEAEAKRLKFFQGDQNTKVEFGRAFETNTLYAKADAVITDLTTSAISIYEIKSSSKVKDEHIYDVAFQKKAAEDAGLAVEAVYVITANSAYIRNGEIDPEGLLIVHDVTDKVAEKMDEVAGLINEAFAYLQGTPEKTIAGYCGDKLSCAFIQHHYPDLPEYTVFDISRIAAKKLTELIDSNIIDIMNVAADFPLSDKQRRQVTVAQSGAVEIDHPEIKSRLDGLTYPLYFLDYETFSFAVPQFEGTGPFQQMPFQFSLHVMDSPGAECRHVAFLADEGDSASLKMASALRNAIPDDGGAVVVWSQGFENTVNKQLGEKYTELKGFFDDIVSRTFDLRKIFSDQLYMRPEFKGRDSIKKVMPVLVPKLSYDELDISEGMTASITWFHTATNRFDTEKRDAVRRSLEDYCHLDTLAMVEIFNVLRNL